MVNKTSNTGMNLEDKAREYAKDKSSSSVFRDAHIRDFKSGYNQALKDTRFYEMLNMLSNIKDQLNSEDKWSVEQLIKQATEL